MNDEFQNLWKSTSDQYQTDLTRKAVAFLDGKIESCNNELKAIRLDALTKLQSSDQALKELNTRMTKDKESFAKSLLEFKTNIRTDTVKVTKNVGKKFTRKYKPY